MNVHGRAIISEAHILHFSKKEYGGTTELKLGSAQLYLLAILIDFITVIK